MSAPRAPRRRTLNRDKVIGAAVEVIDELGWDQLSMTSLSARVGVVVPSLYNHVRSLDDVRGAVQVRTMAELGEQLRAAALGRTGTEGITALADTLRTFATTHPQRYQALTAAPVERTELVVAALDVNTVLSEMLLSCGVPPEESLQAAVSLFAALHGFATLVNSGFLGDELDLELIYDTVLRAALSGIAPARATDRRPPPVG
ncbi:TetR-like C-terminal domain-containing protein [Rhodococcus sp. X156]|uniref:TetR/AcrR family transcriptional regulator n=1 Tax=Rhodococcus sp. X156 TaxID=2499145 RepID=UPI000FD9C0B5|nr:TetR-like C-terminal domain-containing protein [Rhodococcus sp. X156]